MFSRFVFYTGHPPLSHEGEDARRVKTRALPSITQTPTSFPGLFRGRIRTIRLPTRRSLTEGPQNTFHRNNHVLSNEAALQGAIHHSGSIFKPDFESRRCHFCPSRSLQTSCPKNRTEKRKWNAARDLE